MSDAHAPIELSREELREVTSYAIACARRVLPLFETAAPGDARPRQAIEAAAAFVESGMRPNSLRTSGLAAYKAAMSLADDVAKEAGQAATQAVGAAYLHPFASALQVKHILGAAAHAARAAELHANGDPAVGEEYCAWAVEHAPQTVRAVLARYPEAAKGGGRTGELMREIDARLRGR